MIFVLSLTRGIRSQTLCMDAKIRAFFAATMRRGEVTGRNSATGSPRLSITITPPSAASRTNFDVLMCNSRTDVVLICYIVAPACPATLKLVAGLVLGTPDRGERPEVENSIPGTRVGRWLPGMDSNHVLRARRSLLGLMEAAVFPLEIEEPCHSFAFIVLKNSALRKRDSFDVRIVKGEAPTLIRRSRVVLVIAKMHPSTFVIPQQDHRPVIDGRKMKLDTFLSIFTSHPNLGE